jgi:hypothetical protein
MAYNAEVQGAIIIHNHHGNHNIWIPAIDKTTNPENHYLETIHHAWSSRRKAGIQIHPVLAPTELLPWLLRG